MPSQTRRLETVLFLDMVGSTTVAAQIGDARWRELLSRFNKIVRAELKRFGGHEEDTAGDGYFATFPQPGQAVRCAWAIAEHVRELGLEIRSGLHTGETEAIDGKRGGLGVVIGARVMSLGGAGDVLVTSTTKDLTTGSGLEFEDFSSHELKGVPGTWQVFALRRVDGAALSRPLPAEEAVRRFESVQPAPLVTRWKGRIAAAVAVAVIVAAIAVVAATRGTSPSQAAGAPRPVTVLKVDPSTNVVGPVLRDGIQSLHSPASIYFDGSSLWQSTLDAKPPKAPVGKLVRRDPQTGKILGVGAVDTGDGMGFAFGFAWVAHYEGKDEARLDKVDPASGKVVATIHLPGELADVAAGPRSLWYLSTQGNLAEIDPIKATILHRYRVDALQPSRVVPLLGSVWICDCDNGQILRFDPNRGKVTATVSLQEQGYLFGVDSANGNTLWLIDPTAATITPLDPTTGAPGRPLGIGGGRIYDAKIGFGSIWVAAGSELVRFDLPGGTRHVIDIPAGVSAGGLALDEQDGVVWVENCGCPDT